MKTRYQDHVLEARPNADGLCYPYVDGRPRPEIRPGVYPRPVINRIIKALAAEAKDKLLEMEIKDHAENRLQD